MEFALRYQHWTATDFANVLFTDEAPFFVGSSGGRIYVRLRQGERNIPEAQTLPRLRRPGPKILVWGCMRRSGVGPLIRVAGNVTANRYLQILDEALAEIPRNRNFLWMHDNAPAHRAQITQRYFVTHRIQLLSWPPLSPDLNPIENLWGYMTQNMSRTGIETPLQLWNRVRQFWASISAEHCQNLIDSMPRRLLQVRERNGGPTDY
jgi:transposase